MSPKPPDILRKSHRHVERKERAAAKERLRLEASEAAAELVASGPYTGTCSCGAVGFSYWSELPPSAWHLRACQCALCARHAAVYTTDPAGRVEFVIDDPSAVERQRSGSGTLDFICCRRCGDLVGAVAVTSLGERAAVNIRLLEPAPADLPPPEAADYEREPLEARLERWARTWTPIGT